MNFIYSYILYTLGGKLSLEILFFLKTQNYYHIIVSHMALFSRFLLSGIGYFTLPYLVHAKAALLHACEWNPHAVAALRKNLQDNGVADRCHVYHGDNRQVNCIVPTTWHCRKS